MNETALKERLKEIAKGKGITFNQCWKRLLLERVLARIAKSSHVDKLIFKGGFLLSYVLEIGRETIDLDFLVTKFRVDRTEIRKAIEDIVVIDVGDGFTFSWDGIEELAQPHMNYPGFRVSISAFIGKIRDKVQIDFGMGDAVRPETKRVMLFHYRNKPVFESEITLLTYPLETIFSEKLETAVSRGVMNSRMKDYHDLYVLSRSGELSLERLQSSIEATFRTRRTAVTFPIRLNRSDLDTLQRSWTRHLREHDDQKLPEDIEQVVHEVNQLLGRMK